MHLRYLFISWAIVVCNAYSGSLKNASEPPEGLLATTDCSMEQQEKIEECFSPYYNLRNESLEVFSEGLLGLVGNVKTGLFRNCDRFSDKFRPCFQQVLSERGTCKVYSCSVDSVVTSCEEKGQIISRWKCLLSTFTYEEVMECFLGDIAISLDSGKHTNWSVVVPKIMDCVDKPVRALCGDPTMDFFNTQFVGWTVDNSKCLVDEKMLARYTETGNAKTCAFCDGKTATCIAASDKACNPPHNQQQSWSSMELCTKHCSKDVSEPPEGLLATTGCSKEQQEKIEQCFSPFYNLRNESLEAVSGGLPKLVKNVEDVIFRNCDRYNDKFRPCFQQALSQRGTCNVYSCNVYSVVTACEEKGQLRSHWRCLFSIITYKGVIECIGNIGISFDPNRTNWSVVMPKMMDCIDKPVRAMCDDRTMDFLKAQLVGLTADNSKCLVDEKMLARYTETGNATVSLKPTAEPGTPGTTSVPEVPEGTIHEPKPDISSSTKQSATEAASEPITEAVRELVRFWALHIQGRA